ncbi:MAG TPA: flavin reductase family protein [Burkholderiaceae bacterium]
MLVSKLEDQTAAQEHRQVLDSQEFLQVMGQCATSVNVVTTDGVAGRSGATVSAMCSLSAEPPLLLVCLNQRSNTRSAIHRNACFCVNVLASDAQGQRVAQVFAGQSELHATQRFDCANWEPLETAAPALDSALAVFDCEVERWLDQGSHTIFIGRVVAVRKQAGSPLIYAQRAFHQLQA